MLADGEALCLLHHCRAGRGGHLSVAGITTKTEGVLKWSMHPILNQYCYGVDVALATNPIASLSCVAWHPETRSSRVQSMFFA